MSNPQEQSPRATPICADPEGRKHITLPVYYPTKQGREMNVKWLTLENGEATRTLKQHAYIPAIRKMRYTLELYNGNKTLCSKSFCSEDGETADDFATLDSEVRRDDCCKRCLQIFERLSEKPANQVKG